METKNIKIKGQVYQVRYTYAKADGSLWFVLNCDGGLQGEFGDEWPC